MRKDIKFDAEGCRLRGWLVLPDDFTTPVPAVVMAHAFSAVKEMFLDADAELFARAGLAAIVFDHRSFGASEGAPRQESDSALIPVVSNDPTAPAALPGHHARDRFVDTAKQKAPAWRNEVTLRSFEMLMEYESGVHIARNSPTPLLMIVARNDTLAVPDEALAAYQRALEPRRLVILEGGHFDVYANYFEPAAQAASELFSIRLGTPAR